MTSTKSNTACPGCGKTDGLWVDREPKADVKLQYAVACICGWGGPPRETPDAAWEAWNQRKS